MAEDNVAQPTGPNADVPRGARPKAPNAIAEGKGPVSWPDQGAGPRAVDGMQSPHPADAQQPEGSNSEQPQPPVAPDQVAENSDAFRSGSNNANV